MSKVITLSGLGQPTDGAATGCGGAAPGFCDNGSMWIPLTNNIDPTSMMPVALTAMPPHVCALNPNSIYYYNPADGKFYATHQGACDYYWDQHNCTDVNCPGLVGSPVAGDPLPPPSSSPLVSQAGEMRWYHYAALGSLGAGAGYLLFKDRGQGGVAALTGGGLSMLAVGAFRPGGWFRKDPGVGGVQRTFNTNQFKGGG